MLSTLRDGEATGSQEGSQPGLHSLACGRPSLPQVQCCIFVRRTDLCWDAETLGRQFKDTSSDRIQVILAVTRSLGGEKGYGEEFDVVLCHSYMYILHIILEHLH